jgi:hypothetical protein
MGTDPSGPISISTIGDLIAKGYRLSAHCEAGRSCEHSADVDLVALAEKLGRGHSYLAPSIKPYFKCGNCGSKNIGFIVHAPAPVHGVVTPSWQPDLADPETTKSRLQSEDQRRRD